MKDISITGIDRRSLFGRNDQHLAHIEKRYGIRLVARGDTLTLKGPDASVREADGFLRHLIKRMRHGPPLEATELENLIHCSPTLPKGDHNTLPNPVAHTYKTAVHAPHRGPSEISCRHRQQRRGLRHRPSWYRQDLSSGWANGRCLVAAEANLSHPARSARC